MNSSLKAACLGIGLCVVAACGEDGGKSADAAAAFDAQSFDAMVQAPTTDAADTVDAGGPLLGDCAMLCEARDNKENGFCTQEGYFNVAACTDYCDGQVAGWSTAATGDNIWAAFTECVEQDPLCFQTIDTCLMADLYQTEIAEGTDIAQRAIVRGSGFGEHGNRLVHAAFTIGFGAVDQREQGIVVVGAFELAWDFTEPLNSSAQVGVGVYVDADESLACTAEDDLVFGGQLRPTFGTEPLRFEAELDPTLTAETSIASSICTNRF